VRARQRRIRLNLPDALDMLSVCADAGLGFDQALQRVSERWKTPLGREFARMVEEMGMGLSRSDALRSLADRLDVAELSSFVAVIVQSDQMGVSITSTLRSQAEQMRVERRHRAQEEARKAPLKMLLPMIILILPAMGAVVVGPVIPAMMDVFASITGTLR
jgi:tight adherence protein C